MTGRDLETRIPPDEEVQELLRRLPPTTDLESIRKAAKRSPCRHCKSTEVAEVKFARSASHSGKAVCGCCGRFRIYLTKPRDASLEPPPEVLARARSINVPVAQIVGSPEEVARAAEIRLRMITSARRKRDLNRALVIRAIVDPGWFQAHKRITRYDQLVWPALSQMATPDEQVESTTAANAEISDLCDLLLNAKEAEETPVETDWFSFLDEIQMGH